MKKYLFVFVTTDSNIALTIKSATRDEAFDAIRTLVLQPGRWWLYSMKECA